MKVVILVKALDIVETTLSYISVKKFIILPTTLSVPSKPNTAAIELYIVVIMLSSVSTRNVPMVEKNLVIPSTHLPSPNNAKDSFKPLNKPYILSQAFTMPSQKTLATGIM